ncbi:hypothetical protein K439DRAFT_1616651 [Ramaria rubella]|nr:hypothetical protein K439DRAFT_1616651 [Ramaria rubella]
MCKGHDMLPDRSESPPLQEILAGVRCLASDKHPCNVVPASPSLHGIDIDIGHISLGENVIAPCVPSSPSLRGIDVDLGRLSLGEKSTSSSSFCETPFVIRGDLDKRCRKALHYLNNMHSRISGAWELLSLDPTDTAVAHIESELLKLQYALD